MVFGQIFYVDNFYMELRSFFFLQQQIQELFKKQQDQVSVQLLEQKHSGTSSQEVNCTGIQGRQCFSLAGTLIGELSFCRSLYMTRNVCVFVLSSPPAAGSPAGCSPAAALPGPAAAPAQSAEAGPAVRPAHQPLHNPGYITPTISLLLSRFGFCLTFYCHFISNRTDW